MLYDIIYYGHPALRRKAAKVNIIDKNTRKLAHDLLETMYANKGIGLAAVQVDHAERMCVIDVPYGNECKDPVFENKSNVPMPMVLVNPAITAKEGQEIGSEGCLSFPEIYVDIQRAKFVTVTYQDLNNQKVSITASGMLSRALQHEIDHLNGVLFIDRVSPAVKVAISGKLKRLKKML